MAYTDSLLRVSSAQAVTGATSILSTNSIDVAAAIPAAAGTVQARDVGAGEALGFLVTIATTLTSGQTFTIQVVMSANSDLSSPDVICQSAPIPTADCVAGSGVSAGAGPLWVPIDPVLVGTSFNSGGKRYLGLRYVFSANLAAGAVTADLSKDPHQGKKLNSYVGGYGTV